MAGRARAGTRHPVRVRTTAHQYSGFQFPLPFRSAGPPPADRSGRVGPRPVHPPCHSDQKLRAGRRANGGRLRNSSDSHSFAGRRRAVAATGPKPGLRPEVHRSQPFEAPGRKPERGIGRITLWSAADVLPHRMSLTSNPPASGLLARTDRHGAAPAGHAAFRDTGVGRRGGRHLAGDSDDLGWPPAAGCSPSRWAARPSSTSGSGSSRRSAAPSTTPATQAWQAAPPWPDLFHERRPRPAAALPSRWPWPLACICGRAPRAGAALRRGTERGRPRQRGPGRRSRWSPRRCTRCVSR